MTRALVLSLLIEKASTSFDKQGTAPSWKQKNRPPVSESGQRFRLG